MKKTLGVLYVMVLVLGLPSCRLECLGDGYTTFDSLKLIPEAVEILAGGKPIEIQAQGQVHCVGQGSGFQWSLEPALGEVKPSGNPHDDLVTYQPPATIAVNTSVKIMVHFHGYGQNSIANVTIQIRKP